MKKILLLLIAVVCFTGAQAVESSDTTRNTLNKVIVRETESQRKSERNDNLNATWRKTIFFNISYNKTKFSSEAFPSTIGPFSAEYDNDLGVGLQWGKTFNFHRNPIGSVMFVGLDWTWLDLNLNKYKKAVIPAAYTEGEQVRNLPWHNEKMTLGYGMSLGPSLTFYPFTAAGNSGADKVRLQLYFHVGYGLEGVLIKDVPDKNETENKFAVGHGLFMGYGANLTWNFIGVGFEMRNDNNLKFEATEDAFDTGKMKAKEKTTRFYLQFRF